MTIVIIEYQRPLLRIVRRNLIPIVSCPFQNKRLLHTSPIVMGISNYASQDGEFRRKPSSFRNHIEVGGKYPPEKDRYHLYVSWACPWGTSPHIPTNVSLSDVDCARIEGTTGYHQQDCRALSYD